MSKAVSPLPPWRFRELVWCSGKQNTGKEITSFLYKANRYEGNKTHNRVPRVVESAILHGGWQGLMGAEYPLDRLRGFKRNRTFQPVQKLGI